VSVSATQAVARVGTKLSALLAFFAVAAIAGALVACVLTPAVALAGTGAHQGIQAFESLPSSLKIDPLDQKARIYAKSKGKDVVLASFFSQNRDVIAWDQLSKSVKNATIAGEDVRFYHHGGVDPNGIARAVVADLLHKDIQGASTITQQYVKNVCVQKAEALAEAAAVDKAYQACIQTSVNRKIREMRLAIGLEKQYSKDEILLGYLNIAGFGGRNYGIEAAAEYYYGKHAKDLSDAEAASLIAIVNNPAVLRLDHKDNLPAATERRDYILANELKHDMISKADYEKAVGTKITPKITPPSTGCDSAGSAGFFCDYVAKTLLSSPVFGKDDAARYANLMTKGWQVHTTLNLDLQRKAQKIMTTYVPSKSKIFDVGGSAVSVQVGTGRVVTMVQNKKYDASGTKAKKQPEYTAVNYNVNQAMGAGGGQQPGSTFKLFTLLGWLQNGHSLYQTVNGNPRTIASPNFTKCGSADYDDKPWSVGNDEAGEKGNYTVMAGTAASVNGVFASLAEEQDLCALRKQAEAMDATNARGGKLQTVPAMSIGGASSIAPLNMATAYATIANHGVTCKPIVIDSVIDSAGKKLAVPKTGCKRTVAAGISDAAAYALRGVVTGGTMRGDQPDGRYLLGKTGTTDEAKDTWAIGSTTRITTAVWVGNANGHTNLRDVFGFPYCPTQGSTQAAIERHCVFKAIQGNANAVYGGAGGFVSPQSQYLYGGKSISTADARPKVVKPKPAPKPAAKPTKTTAPKPAKPKKKG
jgi:membrane peptidoglycan carboxypeptidase